VRAGLAIGIAIAAAACGRVGFSTDNLEGDDAPVPDADPAAPDADPATAPVRARALACGFDHACVIDAGGRLACVGQNDRGQLGLGHRNDKARLAHVGTRTDWVEIAAGAATCGRHADGSVECWGADDRGQTGTNGTGADVLEPAAITLPRPATKLAGAFHTGCAILDDGALWCWGSNSEGELARGNPGLDTDPRFLAAPAVISLPAPVADVDVGEGHAAAVTTTGNLFAWGANTERELGDPTVTGAQIRTPRLNPDGAVWEGVRLGMSASLFRRTGGEVRGAGDDGRADNHAGPLGLPGDATDHLPAAVPMPADVIDMSIRMFHACALRAGGELWCWGRNIEGQLGVGDTAMHETPIAVRAGVVETCTGAFFTCARRDDDTVECAGKNEYGQLGAGDLDERHAWTPMLVPL
jgi:alpha-tubulin suppressor-like RCC1 family protein